MLYDETTADILAEQAFLRRLALRLARRSADADDLVQETLLRAYRARDRFQSGTSMRAWLSTILRRLFFTERDKLRRRATQTDTDAGEPLFLHQAAKAREPDVESLTRDQVLDRVDQDLREAVLRLPERYREPFLLMALEGLSYEEIAHRLRIPLGTVMSRIHRARTRLRTDFAGEGDVTQGREGWAPAESVAGGGGTVSAG
jgi:RNA polymerase sigma-70 factor, ECF subfamily